LLSFFHPSDPSRCHRRNFADRSLLFFYIFFFVRSLSFLNLTFFFSPLSSECRITFVSSSSPLHPFPGFPFHLLVRCWEADLFLSPGQSRRKPGIKAFFSPPPVFPSTDPLSRQHASWLALPFCPLSSLFSFVFSPRLCAFPFFVWAVGSAKGLGATLFPFLRSFLFFLPRLPFTHLE